jgi:hypothetical protein
MLGSQTYTVSAICLYMFVSWITQTYTVSQTHTVLRRYMFVSVRDTWDPGLMNMHNSKHRRRKG